MSSRLWASSCALGLVWSALVATSGRAKPRSCNVLRKTPAAGHSRTPRRGRGARLRGLLSRGGGHSLWGDVMLALNNQELDELQAVAKHTAICAASSCEGSPRCCRSAPIPVPRTCGAPHSFADYDASVRSARTVPCRRCRGCARSIPTARRPSRWSALPRPHRNSDVPSVARSAREEPTATVLLDAVIATALGAVAVSQADFRAARHRLLRGKRKSDA